LPVDLWATGVIVYGMVTCRMPFKTEQDTRQKAIKISSRLTKDGETFLRGVLERDESKRLTAAGCMQHKFLSSIKSAAQVAEEKMDETSNIREGGANAAVRMRRQELLQRVEDAHNAKKGGKEETQKVSVRKSVVQTTTHLMSRFEVADKFKDKKTTFDWWTEEQCDNANLKDWHGAAPTKSAGGKRDTRIVVQDRVENMFVQYGIKVGNFGVGQAKTLEEFVVEVWKGQSQLMLDATQHKTLVRVVDVVLLRIIHGSGANKQYLIRSQEKYPDGRTKDFNQLMASKKLPHENGLETAKRLLSERMDMEEVGVSFKTEREYFEEREVSPSFPGVNTVYRKEIFECIVTEKDPKVLARLGLGSVGGSFSTEDKQHYNRTYRWCSEGECEKLKIKLRFASASEEVSKLVEAPVGYSEEELGQFLKDNNVDVERFGQDGNKTLAEFADELLSGKASLTKQVDGRIVRVVDLVVLDLMKEDGTTLIEVSDTKGNKEPSPLNRMPAIKSRPDENMFYAAKRLLTRVMRISDVLVSIEAESIMTFEVETPSSAYAGLPTIYRKVVVSATINSQMQ